MKFLLLLSLFFFVLIQAKRNVEESEYEDVSPEELMDPKDLMMQQQELEKHLTQSLAQKRDNEPNPKTKKGKEVEVEADTPNYRLERDDFDYEEDDFYTEKPIEKPKKVIDKNALKKHKKAVKPKPDIEKNDEEMLDDDLEDLDPKPLPNNGKRGESN